MPHILLRVIEAHLRQGSGAGAQASFRAVSFIHRFGASLNRDVHYHGCVIDGVFEPARDYGVHVVVELTCQGRGRKGAAGEADRA